MRRKTAFSPGQRPIALRWYPGIINPLSDSISRVHAHFYDHTCRLLSLSDSWTKFARLLHVLLFSARTRFLPLSQDSQEPLSWKELSLSSVERIKYRGTDLYDRPNSFGSTLASHAESALSWADGKFNASVAIVGKSLKGLQHRIPTDLSTFARTRFSKY